MISTSLPQYTFGLATLLLLNFQAQAQTRPAPRPRAVAAAEAPAGQSALLRAGTIIVMETTGPLSSKDAQVGQTVPLRVKYDVVIRGRAVIKAGAPGSAQVLTAEHRKGMGKQGSLSIKPTVVQAVDGQMVPVTSNAVGTAGEDSKGAAIGLALAVSPLFLLKKGKEASIPPGYEIQANVASDAEIE